MQIIKRPGPGLLAFLLGVAIGVMFTLSAAEMYIRNAYEHGFWSISAAVLGGGALYYFLQPFLPDFADHSHDKKASEVSLQSASRSGTCLYEIHIFPAPASLMLPVLAHI